MNSEQVPSLVGLLSKPKLLTDGKGITNKANDEESYLSDISDDEENAAYKVFGDKMKVR